ncbi:four helix bundle protein [Candidatus Giovannonibacteria bacterium]|nr:four helix bundle protein [Candidatus Giovannonibacteria bacterium]
MTEFSNNNKYDLEERTAKFGENVIQLCKNMRQDSIAKPIINQLIRSATSIGANYMEANGASSKKDFINKIFICKKEAQETKHWLRMLIICVPDKNIDINKLWQECQELTLIFQKIASSARNHV